jgi:hypothetical protein
MRKFSSIYFIFILVFLFILISIPYASADVISLNSGGTGNVIINPSKFIEDFFFSTPCVPYTCVGLGYTCGNWDNGCGVIINCGTCASGYTCTAGTCVEDGAGGGGGGGGSTPTSNLYVQPASITLNLLANEEGSLYQYSSSQQVNVTNIGTTTLTVDISAVGFGENIVVSFDKSSFTLTPGQKESFIITFQAKDKPGSYIGRILIRENSLGVSLNVKSKLLLFDSNIVVLNKDYLVEQGDSLKTQVTLIPLGDKERMDVTLNYEIRDYNNKLYLTKSETLLIENRIDFKRNFDTGSLPIGKYVVSLQLIYTNGVAPSSAHFEVIEKERMGWFGILIWILIILILLIIIIITIILIIRKIKKDRENSTT